jgi:predicted exporter
MVNVKTLAYSAFVTLGLTAALSAAASGNISNIGIAAQNLCGQLRELLPVISMLMIIGAGVIYAAGQIMGAETRARANTWATAMLVGSIIGIVITVVAPGVLSALYRGSGEFNCNASQP